MDLSLEIGDLKFDAISAGDSGDELVIFLHGFPETSFMWRHLIVDIANLRFYCIAPNMRGYSIGACPKGKNNYTLGKLSKDIIDFADWAKKRRFHLIGHDWGAMVGWYTVYGFKERILSWTALSVPHPSAFLKAIETDADQRKKSSYIKLFKTPFVAEWALRKQNFKQLKKIWKHSDADEVDAYLKVFSNSKCLMASLNYYRANFRNNTDLSIGKVNTPTLFLWGEREKFIGRRAVDLSENYVNGEYDFKILNGGHWLVQTNYKDVYFEISKHLNKYKTEKNS